MNFINGGRLKDRVFSKSMFPMLVGFCLSVGAFSQASQTHVHTKSTSQSAEITRFFIEKPKKDSAYETGPLHIIYDDGTETVETLPPLEASTDKEIVFNDVGFSDVQLAADKQTIGWTVDVENCCTSYPIPLRVVILRRGKALRTFAQGAMVWNWMFSRDGERLAVVFGPTHGTQVGDYQLYDVKTGKLISEVFSDEDTQALKPNAPRWAQELQSELHNH